MRPAGMLPIAGAVASLAVWAAHFGFVYAAAAIACERGLAGSSLLGLPLVPLLVLGATVLALAAVALAGWHAGRRLEDGLAGQGGEGHRSFLAWLAVATALLAALAILWEGLPVLLVGGCA